MKMKNERLGANPNFSNIELKYWGIITNVKFGIGEIYHVGY